MTNLHLMKMVVIGPLRKTMYQYIQQVPDGGDLFDLSTLVAGQEPLPVIKLEDHHAKLHIHTLSEEDPQIEALVGALAQRHRDLRFTVYHADEERYTTIHAQGGLIRSKARRAHTK